MNYKKLSNSKIISICGGVRPTLSRTRSIKKRCDSIFSGMRLKLTELLSNINTLINDICFFEEDIDPGMSFGEKRKIVERNWQVAGVLTPRSSIDSGTPRVEI